MNNQGTTNNNNNEITEEGMNLGTTSSNDEDHVRIFVAYDGEWEWDSKEWLFKDSKGSIMVVSKYVTLSQITDILFAKLDVDQDSWGLKLEVHYRVGSPWFPIIEIKCDKDLSLFISESSKTKLPLCVTDVLKDNVAEGVGQDEISPDIEKESPHGRKESSKTKLLLCVTVVRKDDAAGGVEEDEINPDIKEESPHGRKVPHVKHLKEDKVKHSTTLKLLKRICEEVDKTYRESDIEHLFSSPFVLAVENNTIEAIDVLTTYFKGLYNSQKNGQDIYELIVLNRSEKVYSFIKNHEPLAKSELSETKDDDYNNILHLAGRLAPIHKVNAASGAALQMQRELQWFEELKRVVGITYTRKLNKNKETPMMVFRREHEKLRKDGEEWMKKTADSYTITAALIITIVFAAAITVPGGNDSATGKPIYETTASLIIFAMSDAISLFTATTSLLFLSILTARYADEDFLYKLPKRLLYGLMMLFVSVTSMMIAFSAALYIMFGQEKEWILIPIGALACLPIASFVSLQFPLLVELISSTYGHGYFGKEKDYRQSSVIANKKKRA